MSAQDGQDPPLLTAVHAGVARPDPPFTPQGHLPAEHHGEHRPERPAVPVEHAAVTARAVDGRAVGELAGVESDGAAAQVGVRPALS